MSFLDQLSQETDVADGFTKHPMGTFNAKIIKITQRMIRNTPVYDIDTMTEHGQPPSATIWGFSDQDIAQAQYDETMRDKIKKSISYAKKTVSEVLGITSDEARSWTWRALLTHLVKMDGKPCDVFITEDKHNPKYQRVFLNAPTAIMADQTQGVPAQTITAPDGQSMQMNQNHAQMQPAQQQYSSMQQPGVAHNLDDIPF